MQPRHALFLVGTQHSFQIAERRTFQFRLAALLRRAVAPGRRGLDFPIVVLPQCRFEKTRLLAADAIACRVLLWRAIEQNLLQFLHRTGVNHGHFAILQAHVVLTG